MNLQIYKTLWGHQGSIQVAIDRALEAGMSGIEGQAPLTQSEGSEWCSRMNDAGLRYLAEITTAGSYVPDRRATLQDHLNSLDEKLERSLRLSPAFITCLGGCDAWPEEMSLEFFGRAMEMAHTAGIDISFETHRGRSFYNPWTTKRIVEQLPEILLTADFSHWCVVCERLIDSEPEVLDAVIPRVHHIHARVGYDQGPQVPHPAAPEYTQSLSAHMGWWQLMWAAMERRQYGCVTMTPEFGPDGYLQVAPFGGQPVADLWDINTWMADYLQERFERR